MSADYELQIQRRNTSAFIASDPTPIVLTRQRYIADGSGGKTKVDEPVNNGNPQTMRIITNSNRAAQIGARDVDGQMMRPDIVLLGEWDADIALMDRVTIEGGNYVVTWIYTDMRYETVADLTRESRQ